MTTKLRNVSSLFSPFTDKEITIEINENVYPLKDIPEANWLFYSFFGFRQIQEKIMREGKYVKRFASIGTGDGTDALGAFFIFKDIRELFLVDISPDSIQLSENNLTRNIANPNNLSITALQGSLCEPISNINRKVDLIYGNLPNIPSTSKDIYRDYKQSTFYHHGLYDTIAPKDFDEYLLSLQFQFLLSAKEILSKDGSVLPVIGGRFPYDLFKELFHTSGYLFQEICSGFKVQTEADDVLAGYANAETENGVEFDFYLYDASKKLLAEKGITNPTSEIAGKKLKDYIKEYRINATDALNFYRSGVKVGHTCHLFRANKADQGKGSEPTA